jgi:hypothetical protein
MTNPARLVTLTSISGLFMTKHIRQARKTGKIIKTPYGMEKLFTVTTVDLTGFGQLCRCLDTLTGRPFMFVIRGEMLPGADGKKTRRLVHPDPETGEVATFEPAARTWFAVDIDKVKKPVAIDPVTDPEGAIEHLIGLLPPELHDASCWWQLTCSQSLPGNEETLSARLWFWLAEPLDDASLTRWARATNKSAGHKLIDDSLYRAIQPHYVANPIFEDGMRDPLPRRHGVRTGLDEAVTLVIPDPDPTDPENWADEGFVGRGVDTYLGDIGGDRGFRAGMMGAIASYYATNGPDANPEKIKDLVRKSILNAPRGDRGDRDIDRYLSDRHLNEMIGWVRGRERQNPKRQRRLRPDIEQIAISVPVGEERAPAVRAIADKLLKCKNLPAAMALSLTEAFNEAHCSPPLPRDQVRSFVNTLAGRLADRVERGNAR